MTVKWNTGPLMTKVRQAALQAVVRGTEAVLTEAERLMESTPRTGREYRTRGVTHVASSPGNPPAVDTGRLSQSLHADYDTDNLIGTAVASTAYAEGLEFGTETTAARPFMRPALANKADEITHDIRTAVRRALK